MYVTKKYKDLFNTKIIVQELPYRNVCIEGNHGKVYIPFEECPDIRARILSFRDRIIKTIKYLYIIKDKPPSKKVGFVVSVKPLAFGIEDVHN